MNNLMPCKQKQEVINTLRIERMRLNFTASLYDNGVARTERSARLVFHSAPAQCPVGARFDAGPGKLPGLAAAIKGC